MHTIAKLYCLIVAMICLGWSLAPRCHAQAEPQRVVEIRSYTLSDSAVLGTGYLIGGRQCLFCVHGLRHNQVQVLWRGRWIEATPIAVEFAADWCLLLMEEDTQLPAIEVADSAPAVGSTVSAYGYGLPVGSNERRPLRRITGVVRHDCIESDAKPQPGDSGGPIFDARGRMCGIISRGNQEGPKWWGFHMNGLRHFVRGQQCFRLSGSP